MLRADAIFTGGGLVRKLPIRVKDMTPEERAKLRARSEAERVARETARLDYLKKNN